MHLTSSEENSFLANELHTLPLGLPEPKLQTDYSRDEVRPELQLVKKEEPHSHQFQ